jgi:DNA-binding GntR family transcriptional regulator
MILRRGILQRASSSTYHIPGGPARSIDQHRAILDAITKGAADEARQKMLDHLLRVERDIKDRLAMAPD